MEFAKVGDTRQIKNNKKTTKKPKTNLTPEGPFAFLATGEVEITSCLIPSMFVQVWGWPAEGLSTKRGLTSWNRELTTAAHLQLGSAQWTCTSESPTQFGILRKIPQKCGKSTLLVSDITCSQFLLQTTESCRVPVTTPPCGKKGVLHKLWLCLRSEPCVLKLTARVLPWLYSQAPPPRWPNGTGLEVWWLWRVSGSHHRQTPDVTVLLLTNSAMFLVIFEWF